MIVCEDFLRRPADNLLGSGIETCIVASDRALRTHGADALRSMGFGVRAFEDSRGLYLGLLRATCDVLVLDVELAGEDARTIIKELKGLLGIGIIALTASNATADLMTCLGAGADICLVKPLDYRELAANMVGLSYRVGDARHRGTAQSARTWRLTDDGWVLVAPQRARVPLTASERILLQLLFDRANTAISRSTVIEALGHHPDYYLDHRLDMVVSRLRRKVIDTAGLPLPLKAVRGVGYLMTP